MSFIIIDGDTGEVFDIVESRRYKFLEAYFHGFSKEKRDNVEFVAMDMYSPYIQLTNKVFANATICFDKFHVVNHLSRALIKTRIKFMNKCARSSKEYKLLKRNWKLLQKNKEDLGFYDYKPRRQLRNEQLTTTQFALRVANVDKELRATYDAYQTMLSIFRYNSHERFDNEVTSIMNDDAVSAEFKSAMATLIRYKEYVTNNMKYGYNTGKVENSIRFIKQMKDNAFGFKSQPNMKRRILIKFNLIKIKLA